MAARTRVVALRLPTGLRPTAEIGNVGEPLTTRWLVEKEEAPPPTEGDVLGPYYRKGAPFRAKISPPLAKGVVLVVSGRVWGFDTKRPLKRAVLELWQASSDGHYDDEDPQHPPPPNVFVDRTRVVTDETGRYEFETIHPGPYKMDATTWRAPHIHFRVHAPRYKILTTQLFFKGDPYTDTDPFIKASLIIKLVVQGEKPDTYQEGAFDIIMTRRKKVRRRR